MTQLWHVIQLYERLFQRPRSKQCGEFFLSKKAALTVPSIWGQVLFIGEKDGGMAECLGILEALIYGNLF